MKEAFAGLRFSVISTNGRNLLQINQIFSVALKKIPSNVGMTEWTTNIFQNEQSHFY
ncbi:MAG: hypothetical protein V5804_02470 [Mucilaginibacter sp.]|uniref:hypothetical protein n=1 Tax=Mucilaginibacter sp. TaxID=1882438 RepID=UPI0034E59A8B